MIAKEPGFNPRTKLLLYCKHAALSSFHKSYSAKKSYGPKDLEVLTAFVRTMGYVSELPRVTIE